MNKNLSIVYDHKPLIFWYDYSLFGVVLTISAIVSLYFGWLFKREKSKYGYFLAGKEMVPFVVSISLLANSHSFFTFYLIAVDVYHFGAVFLWSTFSYILVILAMVYVFLPVFVKLRTNSIYAYLDKRFDKKCYWLASLLFFLYQLIYVSTVVHYLSSTYTAVTGVNFYITTFPICLICIVLTSIGGSKAVILTNFYQFIILFCIYGTTYILGFKQVGSFKSIWRKSEAKRDFYTFDLNPTTYTTFWSVLIGLSVHFLANLAVNQCYFQKFAAVNNFKFSKRILFYYGFGTSLVNVMAVIMGLVVYVKYNCNSSAIKKEQYLEKVDEFLSETIRNYSGFSNFFVAAVCTSILSILSDNLTNTSCVIYELSIKKLFKTKRPQIPKIVVFLIGLLKICGIYIIGYLTRYFGSTITFLLGMNGAIFGPILGMFLIGMLHPKATGNATFIGGITGFVSVAGLLLSSKFYEYQNFLLYQPKSKISEDCQNEMFGGTGLDMAPMAPASVRISVHYYAVIGCLVTIIVTTLFSLIFKVQKRAVDKILISPIAFRFLSENVVKFELAKYHSVERALYNLDSDSD